MVKPVSKQAKHKKTADHKAAEALANELGDKPYGSSKQNIEAIERLTIALPETLYDDLEALAKKRKRAKQECRSMSAIAREAIQEYLRNHKT